MFGVAPTLNSPLAVSGGTIKNAADEEVSLTFASPDTSGIVVDGRSLSISVSKSNPVIQENAGSGSLTFALSGPTLFDYTFPLRIQGNASDPADFSVASTTVTIPAGQSSATVGYNIVSDLIDETKNYFAVSIDRSSGRSNVNLGKFYYAKVSILDDDPVKDRWKMVSSGHEHSCAITSGDRVKCWGSNNSYELADGTRIHSYVPKNYDSGVGYKVVDTGMGDACGITEADELKCWGANYPPGWNDVEVGVSYKSVSVGASHYCAITTLNELKCWGSSSDGALGDGATTYSNIPIPIDSSARYKFVSVGSNYACGITIDDDLKCWGKNHKGQLGDGTLISKNTPQIIDPGVKYKSVSTHLAEHTCGITLDNEIKCWGGNSKGQIGDGTTTDRLLPVAIDSGTNYESLTVGGWGSCAITSGYALKCWGDDVLSPTVKDAGVNYANVSLGSGFGCGTTVGGIIKCWGNENDFGQLGNGSSDIVTTGKITDSGVSYKEIVGNCGITTTDVLKCWGTSVGDGTSLERPLPVIIDPGVSYASISHGCGITTAGVLKCWRSYSGDGTATNHLKPVVIDPGVTYSSVSRTSQHTCGITSLGQLKCWGLNDRGQIGNGSTSTVLTPVVIDSVNYKSVSAGTDHTCGITVTDELRCWGGNTFGQLGDNTLVAKSTPQTIATSYKQISTGAWYTCGITLSNDLQCWGLNGSSQLGFSGANRRTPGTIAGNYKVVSTYYVTTCGITSTDVLRCWGKNTYGQVGNGTLSVFDVTTPTTSNSGTSFLKVSTSMYHTCGITLSNELRCWGQNMSNDLGSDLNFGHATPIGEF